MKVEGMKRKHIRKPLDKLPVWAFRVVGVIFVVLSPILMTVEAWLNYVADGRANDYKESVKTLLFGRIEE